MLYTEMIQNGKRVRGINYRGLRKGDLVLVTGEDGSVVSVFERAINHESFLASSVVFYNSQGEPLEPTAEVRRKYWSLAIMHLENEKPAGFVVPVPRKKMFSGDGVDIKIQEMIVDADCDRQTYKQQEL